VDGTAVDSDVVLAVVEVGTAGADADVASPPVLVDAPDPHAAETTATQTATLASRKLLTDSTSQPPHNSTDRGHQSSCEAHYKRVGPSTNQVDDSSGWASATA